METLDNTESASASPADRLPRAGEGLQVAHSNHQGWLDQARKGMVRSQLIGAENRALALDASEREEPSKAGNIHESHEGRGHVCEGSGAQYRAGAGYVARVEEATRLQNG